MMSAKINYRMKKLVDEGYLTIESNIYGVKYRLTNKIYGGQQ